MQLIAFFPQANTIFKHDHLSDMNRAFVWIEDKNVRKDDVSKFKMNH